MPDAEWPKEPNLKIQEPKKLQASKAKEIRN